MTVLDLIKSSLRLIRVTASGETPSADMSEDALKILRLMVDEWFNEDLMLYRVDNYDTVITANKTAYTVGEGYLVSSITSAWKEGRYAHGATSGAFGLVALIEDTDFIIQHVSGTFVAGETIEQYDSVTSQGLSVAEATIVSCPDWQTHRPDKLDQAFIKLYDIDYPMEIIYNEQYKNINKKNISSNIPQYCYLDTDWPNATVFLFPVPNTTGTGRICYRQHFGEFTSLSDVINLPHGYEQALRYNLAIELAPEFGKIPDPFVVNRAKDTKGNIKGSNMIPIYSRVDKNLLGKSEKFNFYIG
jgi:hypothetical protein